MTSKEQRRGWVLTRVLKRELTMTEAAAMVGLSERQLWRLRVAFERGGPAGLVHGNRGRPSGLIWLFPPVYGPAAWMLTSASYAVSW